MLKMSDKYSREWLAASGIAISDNVKVSTIGAEISIPSFSKRGISCLEILCPTITFGLVKFRKLLNQLADSISKVLL